MGLPGYIPVSTVGFSEIRPLPLLYEIPLSWDLDRFVEMKIGDPNKYYSSPSTWGEKPGRRKNKKNSDSALERSVQPFL
jgi:hypothetical protein